MPGNDPSRIQLHPSALFAELTVKGEDTCFDAECFKVKREAYVQIEIQKDKTAVAAAQIEETKSDEKPDKLKPVAPLRQLSEQAGYTAPKPDQKVLKQGQWLAAKKGECLSIEQGLIVRGERAGEKILVCCNGACKVHKHHGFLSGAPSPERRDYDLDRYKQHKKSVQNKKRAAARAQLVRQMVEHVGAKIPTEILRVAIPKLTDRGRDTQYVLWLIGLDPKAAKSANAEKIIAKAKDTQLNQLVVAAVLLDSLNEYGDDAKERAELLKFAKTLGLKTASAILTAQDKRISEVRTCRGCGCTEEAACQYWDGNKHVVCKWVEDDLCSNPDCKKYAPAKKVQTAAKKQK